MGKRPEYCYDRLEDLAEDEPCPLCGAREDSKDTVNGSCQARKPYSKPRPYIEIIVLNKWAGPYGSRNP